MFERARKQMIKAQIARRGVRDPRVLAAMTEVPREAFVGSGLQEFAYEDTALPIAEEQTISQPYIVAAMLEAAQLDGAAKVLEVGTGSGYAAALLSRLAAHVFTIERHPALTDVAKERCSALGYRNISFRTGDGTKGWPEEAPFDAILVAAGGPEPPPALKQQLAIGGRLIIPVGESDIQRLVRLTRKDDTSFDRDELGSVHFVPLIGTEGWPESHATEVPTRDISRLIAVSAERLPDLESAEFGKLFDRFASRRLVLLGEASHGTSDFYRARAAITRHLIERHGFNLVAVEADWPDAAAIDRYVKNHPARQGEDAPFQRFPAWMWRNTDVLAFVEWLRLRNSQASVPCSFYGLDIYNMRGSIAAVLGYLDMVDPEAAAVARERYACLTPWQRDPATYGRAVLTSGYRKCEEAVIRQCRALLEKEFSYAARDRDEFLDAAQNARLVAAAERYYRIMYYGGAAAWNMRDTHMFETLEHLLAWHGESAKAVVWAHNSHIGDARETEMGQLRDELNIGQLVRQRWPDETALIGMGTHAGTVAAASDWDGAMQIMAVNPSLGDSFERLCHDAALPRFLLDFSRDRALAKRLSTSRLERFIGVIYRPDTELQSHYAGASLSRQFDAFLWFDQTEAVTEIGPEHVGAGVPDTFPFGI
jgi:protein-L-isoaspartate(D-aspartate) O-methyltransferase